MTSQLDTNPAEDDNTRKKRVTDNLYFRAALWSVPFWLVIALVHSGVFAGDSWKKIELIAIVFLVPGFGIVMMCGGNPHSPSMAAICLTNAVFWYIAVLIILTIRRKLWTARTQSPDSM